MDEWLKAVPDIILHNESCFCRGRAEHLAAEWSVIKHFEQTCHRIAYCAPSLHAEGHACKALSIDAPIYFCRVFVASVSCFLAEIAIMRAT